MAKPVNTMLPATAELLQRFGERLRLARLRRKLTAKQVAARAGIAPLTLRNVESGTAGVTIGAYLAVMQALGLERELDQLAAQDPHGRHLQDSRLEGRTRKVRRHGVVVPPSSPPPSRVPDAGPPPSRQGPTETIHEHIRASDLATLIVKPRR